MLIGFAAKEHYQVIITNRRTGSTHFVDKVYTTDRYSAKLRAWYSAVEEGLVNNIELNLYFIGVTVES